MVTELGGRDIRASPSDPGYVVAVVGVGVCV
jgi:hypothetical protein